MPTATVNGHLIARSDATVIVEGNHYFPPDSVDRSFFRESDTRTRCPWKGQAAYLDVITDGEVLVDAAWYYPTPKDAAAEIAGHVAFWKGRGITVE
jgi:uncharacterized protein (DUF427 family)